MPIYEYICLDCKQRFEVIRPMKDADEPISCASCQGDHTSRMLAVVFATSGRTATAGGGSACSSCTGKTCSSCGVH